MPWSDSLWSVAVLLTLVAVISSASTLILVGELLLARQLIMAVVGLSLMGGAFAQHYRGDRTGTEIPVRSAAQLAGQTAQAVAVQVDDADSDSEHESESESESESADDPE